MPTFRMNGVSQCKTKVESCNSSTRYYLQEFQCCRGELRKRLRFRNMLTTELGETVIGADEKVVATDMVIVIIRRTMGWN